MNSLFTHISSVTIVTFFNIILIQVDLNTITTQGGFDVGKDENCVYQHLINKFNFSEKCGTIMHGFQIPYARHYKPCLVYFYPIFHCGLYCRAISSTDNLYTKQGNSSIFSLKSVVYNQEWIIMARVRQYLNFHGNRKTLLLLANTRSRRFERSGMLEGQEGQGGAEKHRTLRLCK